MSEIKAELLASFNEINIYGIATDKFKTNTINVFFHDTLDDRTVTLNALIPAVLRRGCEGYETMADITKRLEELYGASFDCSVAKKGDIQLIHFYMEYIAERYAVGAESIFDAVLELLARIITNPVLDNGVFREDYVNQEKENLRKLIESRVNDKAQYAMERCFEEMFKGEPFSIYEYGKVEDLEGIDAAGLFRHYGCFISQLPVSIYLTGKYDDGNIRSIIDKFSTIRRKSIKPVFSGQPNDNIAEVKEINEKMSVNQGKLNLGFRTGISSKSREYFSLIVYNGILGGGIHSKLFVNVREKASLAYYAFSRLEKFKGLLMIGSGIEQSNKDKAIEIILKQLDEIKQGNISDYEFDATLKTSETGINSLKDNQLQMVDFFLSQNLAGTEDDFASVVSKIKDVTKEDVKSVAQKIKLDTVYFLGPQ